MLRAVIVDDEIPGIELLRWQLEKTERVEVVGSYTNPHEVLKHIYSLHADVIFLDIEMPKMNGLELASQLIQRDDELMIVFITGYNQFALEAFQVNALHYILKPIDEQIIEDCILRLLKFKNLKTARVLEEHRNVKVCCLGHFEVYGNQGLVKWPTRKVEELCAYFILNRNINIEWEVLGEELWLEGDPQKIKMNLHTSLYRLRKTLKEAGIPIHIISEKGGHGIYRSQLGNLSCDLLDFEAEVDENIVVHASTIERYEQIVCLYKDDLFANRHYEWAVHKKENLQRRYIKLLVEMAHFYTEQGLLEKALGKLLLAEMKAPYDEQIHQQLLMIYRAQNKRALLIECHEQFKRRLKKEMMLTPLTETVKLYQSLLEQ